jgi:hypothetical protein
MQEPFETNFLIVKPEVKLTPTIAFVIKGIDKYFEEAGLKAFVTSGERTSVDQLNTIRKYCDRYGVDKEFPEVKTCGVNDKIDKYYVWQKAWSRLLEKGVIINPPMPASCLFDYIRNGVNKKGQIINHSPHYYGRAFDIGGGLDHDISNELPIVEKAFKERLRGMRGYLPERMNNCLHIDCEVV